MVQQRLLKLWSQVAKNHNIDDVLSSIPLPAILLDNSRTSGREDIRKKPIIKQVVMIIMKLLENPITCNITAPMPIPARTKYFILPILSEIVGITIVPIIPPIIMISPVTPTLSMLIPCRECSISSSHVIIAVKTTYSCKETIFQEKKIFKFR